MPLTPSSTKSPYQTAAVAIDPLADWITADPPPAPDGHRFALIELRPGITVADLRRGRIAGTNSGDLFNWHGQGVDRAAWQQALAVTTHLYPNPYQGRFVTARFAPVFLEWLAQVAEVQALIAELQICVPPGPLTDEAPVLEMAMAAPESAVPDQARDNPVAMAVIDHGIPLSHAGMTGRAAGLAVSRIRSCWFQDGLDRPGITRRCPYGVEVTDHHGASLTSALRRHGSDERKVRHSLDVIVPLRRSTQAQGRWAALRLSHGAAVLGLAAAEQGVGAERSDRPIIAVDLPEAAVMDPSGASLAGHIFDGLVHIADRARALMRNDGSQMPVVVTLSYGNNAGPHDGGSMIERAIADLVERWNAEAGHEDAPLVVVISAGNSFQARGHARWQAGDVASDAASVGSAVGWRILPDDNSPNVMQVWLPQGFAGNLSATLTAPDGTASTLETANVAGHDLIEWRAADGSVVAQALWLPSAPAGHRRAMLQIVVGPTTNTASTGRTRAPCGLWTLKLRTDDLAPGEAIDAYIQSDQRLVLTQRPFRQSYFVDARHMPFLPPRHLADGDAESGPMRRSGAMNGMATGLATLVVGAGQRSPEAAEPVLPALYSGGGLASPNGVDLLAATDFSRQFPGRIVPGMTGNAHGWMFGTSLAAPVAARWVADNIAAFAGHNVRSAAHGLLAPPGTIINPRAGAGSIPGR